MKKTTIAVRAYSRDFEVTLSRKEFLNLDEATEYIKKDIIDTGSVRYILLHTADGDVRIDNPEYLSPEVNFDEFKVRL